MKNVLLFLCFFTVLSPVFPQTKWLNEAAVPLKPNTFTAFSNSDAVQSRSTISEVLDQAFDSIALLSPIKGFNAAMYLPDSSIWKRADGVAAEIPSAVPLTTDHLMGMGSISKSFTAVTLLLLYEDGLLNLDDSIGQYLPVYPNVPGHTTIRQLLGHRSGISDYLNENPAMVNAFFDDIDKIWEPDSILNQYVLPPNFPVGEDWSYSNTNYLLAGQIIESITGQPWHTVMRQRLFDPLGLTHTFAYPFEQPGNQPFSHLFADLNEDNIVDDWQGIGLNDAGLFSLANSAGNLISTPEDLARFTQMIYSGQVLEAATLMEMQTDYILNPAAGLYGLGTLSFPIPGNLENWGHNGDLIYKSVALYFPSKQISLAVQQNDDRSFDPTVANPVLDSDIMFNALLIAYLNFNASTITQEAVPAADVAVFPNPATQTFQLNFSATDGLEFPIPLNMIDINGKIVLSKLLYRQDESIEIGQLPAGIYGVQAGQFIVRVVKN
jgi:D-alanyl-D-alanine carboxypeptidase